MYTHTPTHEHKNREGNVSLTNIENIYPKNIGKYFFENIKL